MSQIILYRYYLDIMTQWAKYLPMANRIAPTLSLLVALSAPPAHAEALDVDGVTFAGATEWNGTPLRLQGAGLLRYRVFIKAYVAALYLGAGVATDTALADVPRRIEIEYFWSINGEDFGRVAEEHIRATVDAETFEEIRLPLAQLNALYEDVKPGDRYALSYLPGIGTGLSLNGERKGVIPGSKLAKAMFGVWIGERPLSASLRAQLLNES